MSSLKIRVQLILGIAAAIFVQRITFRPDMTPQNMRLASVDITQMVAAIRAFVNIVAIMEYEVDRLVRDGAPGGVVAIFVMLAARSARTRVERRRPAPRPVSRLLRFMNTMQQFFPTKPGSLRNRASRGLWTHALRSVDT